MYCVWHLGHAVYTHRSPGPHPWCCSGSNRCLASNMPYRVASSKPRAWGRPVACRPNLVPASLMVRNNPYLRAVYAENPFGSLWLRMAQRTTLPDHALGFYIFWTFLSQVSRVDMALTALLVLFLDRHEAPEGNIGRRLHWTKRGATS